MNKVSMKIGKVVAKTALLVTKTNVNSTCFFHVHQPKLPLDANKLKK